MKKIIKERYYLSFSLKQGGEILPAGCRNLAKDLSEKITKIRAIYKCLFMYEIYSRQYIYNLIKSVIMYMIK